MLPNERNAALLSIAQQPPEYFQVDTLNVFDDSSQEDKVGEVTSTGDHRLPDGARRCPTASAGTAFGESTIVPQGISYSTIVVTHDANGHELIDPTSSKTTIEVVNLLLGKGNDRVTITSTMVPGPDRPRRTAAPASTPRTSRCRPASTRANTPSAHGGITTVHGGGNRALAIKGDFTSPATRCTRLDNASWSARRLRGRPARADRRRGDDVHDHRLRRRERPHARALRGARDAGHAARHDRLGDRPEDRPGARSAATRSSSPAARRTTAAGGPTSPLVLYGDTSQDGIWYSSSTTHPVGAAVRRPAAAAAERADTAATRSRSTRSARPTTSSTSRPPSRSPSSGNDVIDASRAFSRCRPSSSATRRPARAASPSASPPTAARATTSSTAARPATSSRAARATT